MKTTVLYKTRVWLLTLVAATILALSATYASVLLDGMAGTALTPVSYACQHQSGNCGG